MICPQCRGEMTKYRDNMTNFEEVGGKNFAKQAILAWLGNTGGSNAKLLEIATGFPPKVLRPLLAELVKEKKVKLAGAVFRKR